MRTIKNVSCLLLLFLPSISLCLPASAAYSLVDISECSNASAIQRAYDAGWVNGYPDGTFHPETSITRWELAKLLLASAGITPGGEAAQYVVAHTTVEPDILALTDDNWICTEGWAELAFASELINPFDFGSNPEFPPITGLSRYEASLMAVRMSGLLPLAEQTKYTKSAFTDLGTFHAALDHPEIINLAVETGLIGGYTDTNFFPLNSVTRTEAVDIVWNVLRVREEGTTQN